MRLAIAFLLALSTAKSIGQECGREAGAGDIPILEYFEQKGNSLVNIRVPAMEGMECEMWCYEQENMNAAVEHYKEDTGTLVLLHKNGKSNITSQFVPSAGAVDIYVTVTGPTEEDVRSVGGLNPCWQFEKSSTFSSADRENT